MQKNVNKLEHCAIRRWGEGIKVKNQINPSNFSLFPFKSSLFQQRRFNSDELSNDESKLLEEIRKKYVNPEFLDVNTEYANKHVALAKLEYFTQRKKEKKREERAAAQRIKVKEFIPRDRQELAISKKETKRLEKEKETKKKEEERKMEEKKRREEREKEKEMAAKERAISNLEKEENSPIGKIVRILGRVDTNVLTEEDFNSILVSVIRANSSHYVIQYTQEMLSRGFAPSPELIPILTIYFAKNGDFDETLKFLTQIIKTGIKVEEDSFVVLFDLIPFDNHQMRFLMMNWAKENGIQLTGSIFNSLFVKLFKELESDDNQYKEFIEGYKDLVEESKEIILKYLKWMHDNRIEWAQETAELFIPKLKMFGSEGENILRQEVKEGLADSAILAYYCSHSDFKSVASWMKRVDKNREDFLWMPIRFLDKSSNMNHLFASYIQNGFRITCYEYEEAIIRFLEDAEIAKAHVWYSEMVKKGIVPTQLTYEIMLQAASQDENYRLMESLRDDLLRFEVEINPNIRQPLEEHYLI
eukprot:TRINITY_DN3277_c1_g1_i3.p1 TRINITY_DN3277_c1_g1~~TRINITY_DN3277_c1_g1_i3.p1  ORF type:complete len:530 (-),score=184.54 TRINITY_DN3277_c1_g1_i3:1042-2631(-)